ncbi:hypothetical protein [Herminiimonas sp. CN]|uniref:hypothetical protein n=1 Tax=Herminiimonas sp. CN TaxID=1349818 RepID=UPI0004735B8A|nr:hypothetical protein [Herminiimonas sp. CN]
MDLNEKADIAAAAMRATPGVVMYGLTLNELVGWATLAFIVLQCLYLARKWWREESGLWRNLKPKKRGQKNE